MTWIRWDTVTPRAEVVGFLADRLGVRPVTALGHYSALCCGFGDHRTDGRIDRVPDTMLEEWAMWSGRRGRFAAAIREWCGMSEDTAHDPGELRGWWRQKKLLEKQEKDRRKPDGRKKSPANPPTIPQESPTGLLGATNERTNERTTPPPREVPMSWAKVVHRMRREPDRWAVVEFLENLPTGEKSDAWAQTLADLFEGLDLPGGRPASPESIAATCRDFRTKKPHEYTPKFFRTCLVAFLRDGARAEGGATPSERSIRAAADFAGEGPA